jgi:hypothetical protein
MRADNLLSLRRRPFVPPTTMRQHPFPIAPNLVRGLVRTGLDRLGVADIAYVPLAETFLSSRRRHRRPQFGPYDIHTSVNACAMGEVLTRWGESILGGRHGAGVRPVWGRAPGKRGVFLHARLVACGGKGASVGKLGGDRAGEMRISRFLHNRRVTAQENRGDGGGADLARRFAAGACLRFRTRPCVRVDERGFGLSAHPLIAVDAVSGFTFGLCGPDLPRSPRGLSARRTKSGPSRTRRAGVGSTGLKAPLGFARPGRPA